MLVDMKYAERLLQLLGEMMADSKCPDGTWYDMNFKVKKEGKQITLGENFFGVAEILPQSELIRQRHEASKDDK